MDLRNKYINEVMVSLVGMDSATIHMVENAMLLGLENYEITERCTEVAISTYQKDYLSIYLATLRVEGKSEGTISQYKLRISQLLTFLSKDVSEMTVYDLRFFLASYEKVRKVSRSTLDGMRKEIRAFFTWLMAEGHITSNPAVGLKPVKTEKTIKKAFTVVELEKLRNACDTLRDVALMEVLYSTGARVSEIQNLNITDINFLTQEIKILGKGNKERIVYMSDKCAMYLKEYLDSRTDNNPALFVSLRSDKKRFMKPGIECRLKKLGIIAKVENVHPHRYRRSMATHLIDRGCNMQDVQKLLGHNSISTTQIYYASNQNNVRNAYFKYA